jgi:hypothetical protein
LGKVAQLLIIFKGFNVAVLFTNLSEHMPSDPRLAR